MPSWNDLLSELQSLPDDNVRAAWLADRMTAALGAISGLRGDRNVLLYASGFLQRPQVPAHLMMINNEDINALMSVFYGMDWDRGLTMVLHTPGGLTNAAETLVAYIRAKFPNDFEVVVPTFAMSAGTMMSLAANRIWMGRQSQLGPIDPQMVLGGRQSSAMAIVEQFEEAKRQIAKNTDLAHLWAPMLQSQGPSLLMEARNALEYGERMVTRWLEQWMFAGDPQAATKAKRAAQHFNNATEHKSHGRRIDRDEARDQELIVEDLESDQSLQEAVLTAYHLMTIMIEHSACVKLMITSHGRSFLKNHVVSP